MQNRYAGDVGDFGKFSLLRTLFSHPEYKIGVIWYQYPDEKHNSDGRHIEYLKKPTYKKCDQTLVNKLSKVISSRTVEHLERLHLLPDNTIYYSSILNFHKIYKTQKKVDKEARLNQRLNWLNQAIETTK